MLLYTMIITKKSMRAPNQAVIIDIRAGHSRTAFTFSFFIFILLGLITTSKNFTFLTFHLHFYSFTYKLFSSNLSTTFSTTLLCPSFFSVPTITLSIKLATFQYWSDFLVFCWLWLRKWLVSLSISLNDTSSIISIAFHLLSFFICILL